WLATAGLVVACVCLTLADLPRWKDSLSLFDAALKKGPHYVAYTSRGIAFLDTGNAEAALADFNSALKMNPSFSYAYNNRGSILSDQGRYDEAMGDFDAAITNNPYLADAYDNRANALARKGEPEKALTDYGRALGLDPVNASYYNNRAAAYFQLKRLPEA